MLKAWLEDVKKRHKIKREASRLWLFPQAGFAYMQIRKVGSTSICNALKNSADFSKPGENMTDFKTRCSVSVKPAMARQLTQDMLVFAFVRHPLARLYSAYVNKIVEADKHGGHNPFRCHGIGLDVSFEEFVIKVCALSDAESERHIRSQSWFLVDHQGVVPNFIGKLESFAEDWCRLREKLPVLAEVGHMNKAAHGVDYMSAYTPELLDLVYARYKQDFENFGYACEHRAAGGSAGD